MPKSKSKRTNKKYTPPAKKNAVRLNAQDIFPGNSDSQEGDVKYYTPKGDPKKQTCTLCLVMIVKDEEDTIKKCLTAVAPYISEWVIVDTAPYLIEETFNISGANRKLTAKEIVDYVVLPNKQKKAPKQVLMLNNKIVVEGLELYLVTCKDIDETIRLYNKIRVYCFDNKIVDIIFFGSIPKENRKTWYKKIHERTGIGYNRLYRSNSR